MPEHQASTASLKMLSRIDCFLRRVVKDYKLRQDRSLLPKKDCSSIGRTVGGVGGSLYNFAQPKLPSRAMT